MANKKQNNSILYLALAIGGAFLIHKYFMKSSSTNIIKNPVMPSLLPIANPTPESNTYQTMIYNNPDADHVTKHMFDINAGTYQSFYGQVNGNSKKVPILC